jgi:hypothetical protein
MWSTRSEKLGNGRVVKVVIERKASPVTFVDVLRWWQNDAEFRSYFLALLAEAPFTAFRWETPPITAATAHRPFEFVLLDSPGLASEPDAEAFAEHFAIASADSGVVSFPNLGGDALLIVPCPRGPVTACGHLAAFIREAPEPQKHSLWELVGSVMEQRLGRSPVWLSRRAQGCPGYTCGSTTDPNTTATGRTESSPPEKLPNNRSLQQPLDVFCLERRTLLLFHLAGART